MHGDAGAVCSLQARLDGVRWRCGHGAVTWCLCAHGAASWGGRWCGDVLLRCVCCVLLVLLCCLWEKRAGEDVVTCWMML